MHEWDEIQVQRACAADLPALESILRETFASTWLPHLTDEAAASYREGGRPSTYVGERGLLFWVARQRDQILGFVDYDCDFVNALHVRPSHARIGVGNCLMDKAETEIGNAGFAVVRLETDTFNSRSRAFYAARGYREVDRYPDEEWNSGLTTLLLEKAIT